MKSYVRGEAVYIYMSLRGQVCARVIATPSHNNAPGQCCDSHYLREVAVIMRQIAVTIRQVAVTYRRGTSVVRNLKFLTPFFVFSTIKE